MHLVNKICLFIVSCIVLFACRTTRSNNNSISTQKSSEEEIPYYPLRNSDDLDVLVNEMGNASVVLLGESTHGTHEYYEWRAAITKKLVEEKGFNFIAVEGDWTDSYKVDQFIKGPEKDSASVLQLLKQYDRWPSSMWGNYEIASLVQWLNKLNQTKKQNDKLGFYGLDVYSFWEWTKQDLNTGDTGLLKAVKQVRDSFASFGDDALKYADAVRYSKKDYSKTTQQLWNAVQQVTAGENRDEAQFVLRQQAWLALDGERYFRTMVTDRVQSWNIRDRHMAETVKRLLRFHGSNSKAIIWVHNGHAGDAHYSQMAVSGYTSVGEILRKDLGRNKVFSTGFGTDKGSVMAGTYWNGPLQKLTVPPARTGSWENMLHQLNGGNKIILSKDLKNSGKLNQWIGFRSIGAAYSNNAVYGTAIIPQRFDAFVFIDSTTALHPVTGGLSP